MSTGTDGNEEAYSEQENRQPELCRIEELEAEIARLREELAQCRKLSAEYIERTDPTFERAEEELEELVRLRADNARLRVEKEQLETVWHGAEDEIARLRDRNASLLQTIRDAIQADVARQHGAATSLVTILDAALAEKETKS